MADKDKKTLNIERDWAAVVDVVTALGAKLPNFKSADLAVAMNEKFGFHRDPRGYGPFSRALQDRGVIKRQEDDTFALCNPTTATPAPAAPPPPPPPPPPVQPVGAPPAGTPPPPVGAPTGQVELEDWMKDILAPLANQLEMAERVEGQARLTYAVATQFADAIRGAIESAKNMLGLNRPAAQP